MMRAGTTHIILGFLACFFVGQTATAQEICTNSPDDMINSEYFNQMVFDEGFSVLIHDQEYDPIPHPQYQLTLVCPQELSSTFPTSSFLFQMTSNDNGPTHSIRCDPNNVNNVMYILKSDLKDKNLTWCDNTGTCSFVFTLSRADTPPATTPVIYSKTQSNISPSQNFGTPFIPQLSPATVPTCNNSLQCLRTATCQLSSDKLGELQLCESSTSCDSPSQQTPSGYNELDSKVYFESSTSDNN